MTPSKEAEELSNVISSEYSYYTLTEEMALHLAEVILDAGYQRTTANCNDMTILNEQESKEKPL